MVTGNNYTTTEGVSKGPDVHQYKQHYYVWNCKLSDFAMTTLSHQV